ncbi:uracil-DNA glycosylase [Flexibacter flexilis DSM 6793]|uniref:Uracil-DNA glycosylase n=1 Tax=Flexibacter flexilis DSM 6793 TaxID=927664 RepID=A0A1I1DE27_9BACT|nr:uracil-DNA glycosylase [Flexibacter flexilis]SFB73205.1 uracil-DNA glycosylase [Flexibacter flexilis DSM 6793]
MNVQIAESWKNVLQPEFEKPYFEQLASFVKEEYRTQTVYPAGKLIFNAFDKCSFENAKVVILGQDPYHGEGQANGLSFSVNDGVRKPPSLVNIFKEINNDLGQAAPASGNLERWAEQGVLLLNSVLTVRANTAGSHQNKGWEKFTDAVIYALSEQRENLVFILWGSPAQKKGGVIDPTKHLILKSVHPSPLSAERGFYGNHHFSRTNEYLQAHGKTPIRW